MNRHRILVPADFGPRSNAVLEYARSIAVPFEATIDVLYVWQPNNRGRDISFFFADSAAGVAMERALSRLDGCVEIRGRLEFGDVCETIVRIATTEQFDLIVMGLHATARIAHVLRGHLARKVAHAAPCPVLTVGDLCHRSSSSNGSAPSFGDLQRHQAG